MSQSGYILLAHGSRDPGWAAGIQAVAGHVRQIDPTARVRCAYLESLEPDLLTALDELIAEGARAIAVWPMLLGLGCHARDDLPRQVSAAQTHVRASHPDVTITLQLAIAEHAAVLEAMARVVLHKVSNF